MSPTIENLYQRARQAIPAECCRIKIVIHYEYGAGLTDDKPAAENRGYIHVWVGSENVCAGFEPANGKSFDAALAGLGRDLADRIAFAEFKRQRQAAEALAA